MSPLPKLFLLLAPYYVSSFPAKTPLQASDIHGIHPESLAGWSGVTNQDTEGSSEAPAYGDQGIDLNLAVVPSNNFQKPASGRLLVLLCCGVWLSLLPYAVPLTGYPEYVGKRLSFFLRKHL